MASTEAVTMKWMMPQPVDSSSLPSKEEQDTLYQQAAKELRNIDFDEVNRRYVVGVVSSLLLLVVYMFTRSWSSFRTVFCAPLVYVTFLHLQVQNQASEVCNFVEATL